jgi:hypothetical protein
VHAAPWVKPGLRTICQVVALSVPCAVQACAAISCSDPRLPLTVALMTELWHLSDHAAATVAPCGKSSKKPKTVARLAPKCSPILLQCSPKREHLHSSNNHFILKGQILPTRHAVSLHPFDFSTLTCLHKMN